MGDKKDGGNGMVLIALVLGFALVLTYFSRETKISPSEWLQKTTDSKFLPISLLFGAESFSLSAVFGVLIKLVASAINRTLEYALPIKQKLSASHWRNALNLGSHVVAWVLVLSVATAGLYITLLWAANPSTEITLIESIPSGNFDLLWGLITLPQTSSGQLIVTAGSLAWGLMNAFLFLIAYIATPKPQF